MNSAGYGSGSVTSFVLGWREIVQRRVPTVLVVEIRDKFHDGLFGLVTGCEAVMSPRREILALRRRAGSLRSAVRTCQSGMWELLLNLADEFEARAALLEKLSDFC